MDFSNVSPTTVTTNVININVLPSLNDHLAATKIQSAYRQYMKLRNTKSSLCQIDARSMPKDSDEHNKSVEGAATHFKMATSASTTSSDKSKKPIQIQSSYRDHVARSRSIYRKFTLEWLLKFHTHMLEQLQALIRVKQSPKAKQCRGFLEVGTQKYMIPYPKKQNNDTMLTVNNCNCKLHLEPESRRHQTLQLYFQHDSILDCHNAGSSSPQCSSRKSCTDVAGLFPVYLNVYDLTPINCCLYWLGLGAHHSAIQVRGVEYAFGMDESGISGIFKNESKKCEEFTFREEILIGWTRLGPKEIKKVIKEQSEEYIHKGGYHLITKNCNDFSTEACVRLTGNTIPPWVNRLARIGSLFVGWTMCCWKGKETSFENEVKISSHSKRFISGSSDSSSFSDIGSDIIITGKSSRWKETVLPSSAADWII